MTTSCHNQLAEAAQALAAANHVVVFTGAGISKESGIPTFRDAQTGLWEKFNPEDLATREGFLKNPQLVWDWYDFRRNKVWPGNPEGAKANKGHQTIAALEKKFKNFTLITQNIDNLHAEAGSTKVLELHGNIFRYKCLDNNHPLTLQDFGDQPDTPPRCPQCQNYVRPEVVWFGEMLPKTILDQSFAAAEACDVMLVVGTSGVVQPAASLPVLAKRNGATIIEVNPEPSTLTDSIVDIFLRGPSGEVLPQLLSAMEQAS